MENFVDRLVSGSLWLGPLGLQRPAVRSRPVRVAVAALLLAALAGGVGCRARGDSEHTIHAALGSTPGTWAPVMTTVNSSALLLASDPVPGQVPPPRVNTASGAIQSIATHPTDANIVYVASASGGIWKTTNALAPSPLWQPLTDALPWLWSGTLTMDPTNPNALAAGNGNFNSGGFIDFVRALGLIYVTSNGGSSWTVLDQLQAENISALALRGTRLVVGTFEHGVFLGDTSGSFRPVTAGLPTPSGNVFSILAAPGDGSALYAAIGPTRAPDPCPGDSCVGTAGGIFLTQNGGTLWTNVATSNARLAAALSNCPSSRGACATSGVTISVGPTGRLYAAVAIDSSAVWIGRTDDRGAHWVEMELPKFPIVPNAPTDPTVIRFTGNIGQVTAGAAGTPIEITTDAAHGLFDGTGGSPTVHIQGVQGVPSANGDWIAVPDSPADPNKFLIVDLITRTGTSTGPASCSSASACGGTWQSWLGGNGFLTVAADPTNPDLVYLGATDFLPFLAPPGSFDSQNGPYAIFVRGDASVPPGNSVPSPQWTSIASAGTDSITSPHADPRGFVVDAAGGLYNIGDGGLARHTNPRGVQGKGDWVDKNGNLATIQIRDMAIDTRSGLAFGGTQDNGTIDQPPSGTTWIDFTGGDGGDVQVDDRFANVSFRYHGSHRIAFDVLGNVRRDLSPDVFLPLTILDPVTGQPTTQQLGGFGQFMINKSDGAPDVDHSHLVFSTDQAVYESLDGGATVRSLRTSNDGSGPFLALAYGHTSCPGGFSDVLWAFRFGASPSILARLHAGDALAATANQLPVTSGADIALGPQDCTTAYVADGSQVFVTRDGGATPWTDITGDLASFNPGLLHSLQYVPSATGDRLFVAATPGVFMMSVANPGVWVRAGTGLPNAVPRDLDYDPTRHTLEVALFGRGVFALTGAASLNQAPHAVCRDATVQAGGASCQASVAPTAIDGGSTDPDGDPIACTLSPTGPFTAGTTPVTLTCVDPSGAGATCPATVTVQDRTAPRFTAVPGDITTTSCGAINIGAAAATDACGGVTITNNAPARFPPGTTLVTWKATDQAGNSVTATQRVTVILGDNPACCPAGTHVILGTSGNDRLTGTSGADCILGLGGQDVINGLGGNDFISGGGGDDVIDGGDGNDVIFGGTGQDQITGGTGDDVLSGDDGDDTIHGGLGNDTIHGGQGQDFLFGEGGNDRLFGDDGDDHLDGGDGNDDLVGSGLHDTCVGGAGANTFTSCQTPATNSCVDRIKDGTETDVDCGGACARCAAGRGCVSGADCTAGLCVNGACQ